MKSLLWLGLLCCSSPAMAAIVTFDDLAALPPVNSQTGLYYANEASSDYQGVVWDSRVNVVGSGYRVDDPSGPLFGIPHSGDYFITNDDNNGVSNDGIVLTTTQVLLGAWFGRNEYYGFGGGATEITIYALSGLTELDSVTYSLPAPATPGQPGAMGYVDTGVFATLSGITGYRIDRVATNEFTGSWVADDFQFVAANVALVPEPGSLGMLVTGLASAGGMALRGRRRQTTGR